ncbi:MAG: hypothetical protein ACI4XI_02570 [Ruminococcus sp.]
MKKVNFNQLKSVKTPENWIENAIKIPQKNKKKPVYLNPYIIASAACFVFCCALCAVVFLNFGIDNPIPVAPVKSSGTSVSDVTDSTTPSSNLSVIPTISNPIINNIPTATAASQQQTGSVQKSTNPSGQTNETVQGSTGKNSSASQSVVTNPEPTEIKEGSNSNTSNTDRPAIPDTPETEPTQPVTDPTEPPTVIPTPTEPGIPPIQPTISGSDEKFTSSIYFCFSSYLPEECEDESEYYCHIMSASGQTFAEKFSSVEKATVVFTQDGITVQYNPYNKGLRLKTGNYYLTFYDNYGNSYTYYAYLGNQSVYIYQ